MTYLLFLNRIETTFGGSSFQPSRCTIHSLYVLLTLYFLIWCTACTLPIANELFEVGILRETLFDVQYVLSVPIGLVDVTLSISMTYIFVSRLYRLILLQTAGNSMIRRRIDEHLEVHGSFLSHSHYQMIRISVKIAVLAITSLTSSLILLSFRAVSFYLSYESPMAKVAAIWIQVDVMLSCLCLLLFLPKTQRGFLCFCCLCHVAL